MIQKQFNLNLSTFRILIQIKSIFYYLLFRFVMIENIGVMLDQFGKEGIKLLKVLLNKIVYYLLI